MRQARPEGPRTCSGGTCRSSAVSSARPVMAVSERRCTGTLSTAATSIRSRSAASLACRSANIRAGGASRSLGRLPGVENSNRSEQTADDHTVGLGSGRERASPRRPEVAMPEVADGPRRPGRRRRLEPRELAALAAAARTASSVARRAAVSVTCRVCSRLELQDRGRHALVGQRVGESGRRE